MATKLQAVGGISKRAGRYSVGWMIVPTEDGKGYDLTINYYPDFQTTVRYERLDGMTLEEAKEYAQGAVNEILEKRI